MSNWFATTPLWILALVTMGLLLVSILSGVLVARFGRRRREDDGGGESVGTIVGAALGLLAFILAFTFGMTATRFDARKSALLDEVNAIETTYLRVDLIPAAQREDARELIREYVAQRVGISGREDLAARIRRSEEIQRELWVIAASLSEADLANADITSLWIDSLNEMIDLHTKRVTIGIYQRVPPAVWATLIGITVLAMAQVGYLFAAGRLRWTLILGLALAFSVVLVLIVDLDRSGSGGLAAISLSQQPMSDLQVRIAAPAISDSLPNP